MAENLTELEARLADLKAEKRADPVPNQARDIRIAGIEKQVAALKAQEAPLRMGEKTEVQKVAEAKAALDAKNAALVGKFMDQDYDWVEGLVHKTWLPNALAGRVVGSVLESVAPEAPVEQMVNIVRRAYYAHENRPIVDWQPRTEYRFGDRVKGPDGKVYAADAAGISGATFGGIEGTVKFDLEDPQPVVPKPAPMLDKGPASVQSVETSMDKPNIAEQRIV